MHRMIVVSWTMMALACGEDVDLNNAAAEDAFISGNVRPDSACAVSPDGSQTQAGLYDIAPGGSSDFTGGENTDNCDQPYALQLLVESEGGELALFQEAEVTLLSQQGERFYFQSEGEGEGMALPNPFQLTVAGRIDRETGQGIVQVNAIPPQYAVSLEAFVDSEIVIAVSLKGRTMDGRDIDTQTFRLPVRICYGCLTQCASRIEENMLSRDDVVGDECDDNAGADDRVCIDPEC